MELCKCSVSLKCELRPEKVALNVWVCLGGLDGSVVHGAPACNRTRVVPRAATLSISAFACSLNSEEKTSSLEVFFQHIPSLFIRFFQFYVLVTVDDRQGVSIQFFLAKPTIFNELFTSISLLGSIGNWKLMETFLR